LDIPREPRSKRRRYIYIGLAVAVVAGITIALSRLQPAAPSVDRGTVWVDTVERGLMVRQVRGPGTLVPEQIRWISAVTAGRVEKILLQPGAEVDSSTQLLTLSNPDVEVQTLEAQSQLTAAQAQLRLSQQGMVATVQTQYRDAQRTVKNDEELAQKGLISEVELERARDQAEELKTRLAIEQQRLQVLSGSIDEQVRVQQAQVARLRDIVRFHRNRVASMNVVAGVSGVLAEMSLQEGQWVTAGTNLARIVQPGRLKAELRIPQTQARDVAIGQPALIDTRNDTIAGHVVRIDPAVQNGTVTVDVTLDDSLPEGARPDLSVDGTIEIERLEDVLYVGRPAYGQANSTVGLFKLVNGGKEAVRVNVRLGRSSVNTIEIQNGLQAGDAVILSDMSAWDGYDRVRLD
jgi:multidrug efflux pump subunit AcrA (membrane-fusion protein)